MGIVLAAAEAATKKPSSSSTELLLFIVLIFAGFYFLMIRPQRRRQQQAQQRSNTVTPGASVRTIGGMFATVSAVEDDDVILEVAPGVEVRYMKRAIAAVLTPGEPQAEETVADDEPGYHDDTSAQDDTEVNDTVASAEDGLASSHDDDLASSDKDNVF